MCAVRHVPLRALARIGEDDHARLRLVRSLHDRGKVIVESRRDHQHRGAELVESHEHLFGRLRLSHDAHLVFNGQHFGDASSENRLIIGQD